MVDYKALVDRVIRGDLPGAVDAALRGMDSDRHRPGLDRAIADRPAAAAGAGWSPIPRPHTLTPQELDAIDAVVTTARVAIAMSGTIILDGGPGQGRRAITLVPDRHVIVLTADQVVETVAEAIAMLSPPHR